MQSARLNSTVCVDLHVNGVHELCTACKAHTTALCMYRPLVWVPYCCTHPACIWVHAHMLVLRVRLPTCMQGYLAAGVHAHAVQGLPCERLSSHAHIKRTHTAADRCNHADTYMHMIHASMHFTLSYDTDAHVHSVHLC